jgi:hypothetical protein
VAVGAVLLTCAVACWTWLSPGGAFIARDAVFSALSLEHLQEVALGARPLTRGPLAWPMADSITQCDWMPLQAAMHAPLRWLDPWPMHAYALSCFTGIALTALAVWYVARALTGPGPHAWVAGAIGGLHPLQMAHAQHTNLVHHELMVVGAAGLGWALVRRRPTQAALFAALAVMGMHLGVYAGAHGVVAAAVVAAAVALTAGTDRRTVLAAVGGAALMALTVLPVASLYAGVALREGIVIDPIETGQTSWHLLDTLAPLRGTFAHYPLQWVWPLSPHPMVDFNPPTPGYTALALGLMGLGGARKAPRWVRWSLLALALLGGLLALGPDVRLTADGPSIPGPYRLAALLPGVSGLRAPARWLVLPLTAWALVAAFGARTLFARVPRARIPLAALLLALVAAEAPRNNAVSAEMGRMQPVYHALDGIDVDGALWDEALRHNGSCDCKGGQAIRAGLFHGRPLAGGHFARRYARLEQFNRDAGRWPQSEAVELLRDAGVAVALEHPPLGPLPTDASCTEVDGHRLCVLDVADPPHWPRRRTMAEAWDFR